MKSKIIMILKKLKRKKRKEKEKRIWNEYRGGNNFTTAPQPGICSGVGIG